MVGLIVTGHANFASGMTSALKLISGSQIDNYQYVDFKETDSVELLEKNLKQAFDQLKNCKGILVCSDIIGGSPFKSATVIGMPKGNVQIIAGTNLPMLIEINMVRQFQDDIVILADQAVETGKSMVSKYVFQVIEDVQSDDGI